MDCRTVLTLSASVQRRRRFLGSSVDGHESAMMRGVLRWKSSICMHEIIITVRSSIALHCIALRYCSILAYPSDRPDDVRQVASGLRDAGVSRSPQRDWTLETKTCMERCSRRIALHSA